MTPTQEQQRQDMEKLIGAIERTLNSDESEPPRNLQSDVVSLLRLIRSLQAECDKYREDAERMAEALDIGRNNLMLFRSKCPDKEKAERGLRICKVSEEALSSLNFTYPQKP